MHDFLDLKESKGEEPEEESEQEESEQVLKKEGKE